MPPLSQPADVWAASARQQLRAEIAHSIDDPFHWDLYNRIGPGCELLGPVHGRDVVDLGCGTGRTIAHLTHHHGARGTGLDSSPAMTELAAARFADLQGLSFVTADAVDHLAQHRNVYDVVLSRFGAVCFAHPLLLLPLVAAALRPGGVFVFSTMAQHGDGTPASAYLSISPTPLPQHDGSTVTVPRRILSRSLWERMLSRDFVVQHVQRLVPRDLQEPPEQPLASWVIRAMRR